MQVVRNQLQVVREKLLLDQEKSALSMSRVHVLLTRHIFRVVRISSILRPHSQRIFPSAFKPLEPPTRAITMNLTPQGTSGVNPGAPSISQIPFHNVLFFVAMGKHCIGEKKKIVLVLRYFWPGVLLSALSGMGSSRMQSVGE